MKKIRMICVSLLFIAVLGLSGLSNMPVLAQEPGPQGGNDSVKRPACFPRCRPASSPEGDSIEVNSSGATSEDGSLTIEVVLELIVLNVIRLI